MAILHSINRPDLEPDTAYIERDGVTEPVPLLEGENIIPLELLRDAMTQDERARAEELHDSIMRMVDTITPQMLQLTVAFEKFGHFGQQASAAMIDMAAFLKQLDDMEWDLMTPAQRRRRIKRMVREEILARRLEY